MQLQRRRTPCVGICSTTYGDLICRGCKRFAHEIVAWNGYSHDQRGQVWERLGTLRDGCVEMLVEIVDVQALRSQAAAAGVAADATPWTAVYEVLRGPSGSLERLGIAPRDPRMVVRSTLCDAIDQEFYRRSVAHYERNFKTSLSS